VLAVGLGGVWPASAGGPLIVGGTLGPAGVPFTWDTSLGEFPYRTDGGKLGVMDNAAANARVAAMFQVWEDVPTASIGFNNAGPILSTGTFSDGNVNKVGEFNAVSDSCEAATQSPIVYDGNGKLFDSLFGENSGVIGLAGPCALNDEGRILSALVALNGDFRDGDAVGEYEVTDNEFDAVFIHEFGHLFGLGHSQANLNCLTGSPAGCSSFSDDAFGLPTMFPFLLSALEETPGVNPARTLSQDDIAWVSKLYPDAGFSSSFGVISGTILFGDGLTPAQGVNVIARQVDDLGTPENEGRRVVVSAVSGYLFTGTPGQSVTGTNPPSPFGSRNPLLIGIFEIPVPPGSYRVEVESVLCLNPVRIDLVPKQLAAVRAFLALSEAESLAAANKRVANILKQAAAKGESFANAEHRELKEPAERELLSALRSVSQKAKPLFDQGDYTGYLKAFALLKSPVDRFFESVMVMVDDENVRRSRLALLTDLRTEMNRFADISKLAA